jgi:hypothetical protein
MVKWANVLLELQKCRLLGIPAVSPATLDQTSVVVYLKGSIKS